MSDLSIRFSSVSRLLLTSLIGFMLVVSTAGCTGCWKDDATAKKKEEDEKKKKKKKADETKPDFEMLRLDLIPSDRVSPLVMVKPGHWIGATQVIRANNFDFQATLQSSVTDKDSEFFEVPHTLFTMTTTRPAALPKGQGKPFETLHFPPPRQAEWKGRNIWFRRELLARGGRIVATDPQPVTYLPTYQYMFLVLANDPDLYAFTKQLTTVRSPTADLNGATTDSHRVFYHIVAPKVEKRLPIPTNSLAMTSMAYILWDGVDPKSLSEEQEVAIIDWLHWGGQLLVSGPDSLDLLRGSFLEPYLPALKSESAQLDSSAFTEMSDYWSVPDKASGKKVPISVVSGQSILGAKLAPHVDAHDVGKTGGLVLERMVGRGRIVVTAFPLAARELLAWGGSYDGFFHGCLLRRPRRLFQDRDALADATYVDFPQQIQDARFVSNMRYFSRDVGHFTGAATAQAIRDEASIGLASEDVPEDLRTRSHVGAGDVVSTRIDTDEEGQRFAGYMSMPQSGVAGWNDRSGVSDKAREALRDAAGISIPNASFVFRVLAIYLLVLAPINFGFFWLIGRIEWAWVSAPILAIIGAIAVVRLAQLDIGFARSLTEVATLELHGDYPRGHLTRYTALYTSLSTSYNADFETSQSLSLPFPTDLRSQRSRTDTISKIAIEREDKMALRGFQVPSNKTGMLHTEQMLDVSGPIKLLGGESAGWELQNNSTLTLREAAVIRRTESGNLQIAWLGEVNKQQTYTLAFENVSSERPTQWEGSEVMSGAQAEAAKLFAVADKDGNRFLSSAELGDVGIGRDTLEKYDSEKRGVTGHGQWNIEELQLYLRRQNTGKLRLGQLADLALMRLKMLPGSSRLVGWTDESFTGMTIQPASSQTLRRTLVVTHLSNSALPIPVPDSNCLRDALVEKKDDEEKDGGDEKENKSDPNLPKGNS